jgi:hypothetical protein
MTCLPRKPRDQGTVLVIVIALLALMCVFMTWSAHSIFSLKSEIKLIEQKQLKRYENAVAVESRPQ